MFWLPLSFAYSTATLTLAPMPVDLSDVTATTDENGPAVAASDSGQLIVTWTEEIGVTQDIQSSSFRSGVWQPAITINTDGAEFPSVGLDESGNAVITFTVGMDLDGSTLSANANAWASPTTITTATDIQPSDLATDPTNGNSITIWSEGLTSASNLYSSSFIGNTWSTPVMIEFTSRPYKVYIDPFGTPFAIYSHHQILSGFVYISDFVSSTWSAFSNVSAVGSTSGTLGFDSSGNSISVWSQPNTGISSNSDIVYSTLVHGETNLSTPSAITSDITTNGARPQPSVVVDAAGDAVATWLQANSSITGANSVFVSTYSHNTASWSTPVAISASGANASVNPPVIAIDSSGDAIVVWTDSTDMGTTEVVEVGFLPFGSTTWQVQSVSSTVPGSMASSPQVAISPAGNVVIAWDFTNNGAIDYIQALNGTIISSTPTPNPPSSISGVKDENRFLFQSEFYDVIAWGPSTSSNIVAFRIYRNGTLIAQVGSSTFTYTDHLRGKHQVDTYAVTTLNSSGQESSPIQITVQ